MSIWFTSDHHFFHKNIIKLCNRPFDSLENMHYVLKNNWNELIKPEDTVYIVGDLSFGQESSTRKLCKELNGKLNLIQGNHDKDSKIPRDCFEKIVYRDTIEIASQEVLLCHYPYKGTPEELKHAEENGYKIKHLDRRPEDKGGWLIHGHIHEKWKFKRKMINVSVEVWDYKPVHISQIEQWIKGSEILDELVKESQELGLYETDKISESYIESEERDL